jgi:iron complex transport system ATP-binding protein
LDGIAVGDISPSARARAIAYVPQVGSLTFSYNATEVAVMGRSPWLALHQTPSRSDLLIVDEVFERLSLSALKDQPFARLSSGEKQLVLIARALVQTPQYLVLDEPMSNLDFGNQSRVLSRIEQLRALGLGILMTTHHPNHAFETNGRVILIDKTRRIQVGAVDEILTAENLLAAYGVEVSVLRQELETGSVRRFCVSRRGRVAS